MSNIAGEAAEVWWSPNADLGAAGAAARLGHALIGSPVCLVPRRLDPGLRQSFDSIELRASAAVNLLATPSELRAALDEFPIKGGPRAEQGWSWLREDIRKLLGLFEAATPADVLYVKLRLVTGREMPSFATRSSPFFLVALYRGPPVAWALEPALAVVGGAQAQEGAGRAHELSPGTVAFLRGSPPVGPTRSPGVWRPQRSDGGDRLLLTIEDGGAVPFGG